MSSGNTNNLYKRKDNANQSINSNRDKKNISYITGADILTNSLNYSQSPYVYIKLDPEYLENNYQNEEKKYAQNYRTNNYTLNDNYNINNNSINKNEYMQQYPYLKNQRNTASPMNLNNNHLMYGNNTLDDSNRKRNSINDNNNEYKTVSPIKKYIEKKNFNFYINNGIFTQGNNNTRDEIYLNKSLEINKLHNNRYNYNNINDVYNNENQRSAELPYLKMNIYQKKMINIFAQIINKIIDKNRKKEILRSFFNNFKKYYLKKKVSNKHKFQKKNTKYNEYKNIINNYVKNNNNSKQENELNKNEKDNKIINDRNNNLREKKTDYNQKDKKRLKELQKKYEKIYEKRKNSTISIDDKYNGYMLRKTKTVSNLSKKNQNDENNESFIEQNKAKLLKTKLIRNANTNTYREKKPLINLRQRIYPYSNFKSFSNNKNLGDTPTKNADNKKIITKKLKITPRISKNLKEESINNKKEEIYTIYNIKDIITSDKRLYVYINYITLDNKEKEEENKLDYYDDEFLRISNEVDICINGLNIKKNKNKSNNYLLNQSKYLSKIEEEPYDKNCMISSKDQENIANKNNMEKAILILEKYKNKLKKEILKKNISNYKK